MATPIQFVGANGKTALATRFGEVAVGPIDHNSVVFHQLTAAGTAFNFLRPIDGEYILIDSIDITAQKSVSPTTAAEVIVFEADSSVSTAPSTNGIIVNAELLRSTNQFKGGGLDLLIPQGRFVNATTTEATINITIYYHRLREVKNG